MNWYGPSQSGWSLVDKGRWVEKMSGVTGPDHPGLCRKFVEVWVLFQMIRGNRRRVLNWG
jgi:hypothetical protein